jgi:hypothetical protein
MEENHTSYHRSIGTDDCLKAAGVLKRWKTMLMLVVAVCLLLQQMSFYLLDQGYTEINEQANDNEPVAANQAEQISPVPKLITKWFPADAASKMTLDNLTLTTNFINAVLISAGALYCLTLLLSLEISIQSSIGGSNHGARAFGIKYITRAFILSLLMVVLLLPWQKFLGGVVTGAVFTPQEMVKWHAAKTEDMLNIGAYYLRFYGYGLAMFLLLVFSNSASRQWAKAFLRRSEAIEAEYEVEHAQVVSKMTEAKPSTQQHLRRSRALTVSMWIMILSTILVGFLLCVGSIYWSRYRQASYWADIILGITYIVLGVLTIASCVLIVVRDALSRRKHDVGIVPAQLTESTPDSPFPIRFLPAREIANNAKIAGRSILKRLLVDLQRTH